MEITSCSFNKFAFNKFEVGNEAVITDNGMPKQ